MHEKCSKMMKIALNCTALLPINLKHIFVNFMCNLYLFLQIQIHRITISNITITQNILRTIEFFKQKKLDENEAWQQKDS